MDPPLVNEASFTAASNPSLYSLAELLPFRLGGGGGGSGFRLGNLSGGAGGLGDVSVEESTVTEQSGGSGGAKRRRDDVGNSIDDDDSKFVSNCSANHDLNELSGKRIKETGSGDDNGGSKAVVETNSGTSSKPVEEKSKAEPPKDYIHVRARRGQATDSHSLAERARREKISERMKILQDLVPGCNKVIGKALVLDEIINYIQSLQHQVEFLSMKLEAVDSRPNTKIEGFPSKDIEASTFDANGMMYGSQAPRGYPQAAEWLHMQVGSAFERATRQ